MLLANTHQIREADRIQIEEYLTPGIILMENAGRLATEKLLQHYPDQQTFLVLAGPGNNGGDGLVMARFLHLAGKEVFVLLSHPGEKYKGDAKVNFDILQHLPVPIHIFDPENPAEILDKLSRPILIDALLGTGIKDKVRGPIAQMIQYFSALDLPVVAVDLPSGLNADTGKQINTVLQASFTYTFQLPKICHYVTPASNVCGEVITLDIGIWPQVIEKLGIRRSLLTADFIKQHHKSRKADSHKGTFGHVLVIAGSRNLAGAPGMAAYAALKAGAGLVTLACPDSCRMAVYRFPEVMCTGIGEENASHFTEQDISTILELLKGKNAVMLGPGMGTHEDTQTFFRKLIPQIKVPLVLDADGLNLLSTMPDLWDQLPPTTILTPHPGEMQRLTRSAASKTQRLESAESLARDKNRIIVLKGAGTIIALPNGHTYVNTTGNPGMATGGSGDVLTGIIGGLLGQGYTADVAAATGVYLHGKAGDVAAECVGQEGVTAMGTIEYLFS